MRAYYIESNFEEDIDMKNQYRFKNLKEPISIRGAVSKILIATCSRMLVKEKNTTHVDFNVKILDNVRSVKVNSVPAKSKHLSPEQAVDDAIDETSFARNNPDNHFNNHKQTNINSPTLNTRAVNDNQVITKAYVDQFHQENER